MEAGSTTRKGSSNSIANTHNRIDLYCAYISSKVQPAEKLSLRKKERQCGSTSGHGDIYYIRAQPSTYTEITHHISKTSFLAQQVPELQNARSWRGRPGKEHYMLAGFLSFSLGVLFLSLDDSMLCEPLI